MEGAARSVPGTTEDASLYGLGVLIASEIPIGTEVSVTLSGVAITGTATIRHVRPLGSEFRAGLQLEQALFMQEVPGLDEVLIDSFYSSRRTRKAPRISFLRRLRARFTASHT